MDEASEHYYFLAIHRMKGVGPLTIKYLMDLEKPLAYWFSLSAAELKASGLPKRFIQGLMNIDKQGIQADIEWQKTSINRYLLTQKMPWYPTLLKEISDPPIMLYAEGDISILKNENKIAIVGSRHPTALGLENAEYFAYTLAKRGYVIVSGLASGIDAAAHRGAMDAGGTTIAVMGTGIDMIYPYHHRLLAKKIIEQGVLLTEFALKTPPMARHFPQRNRIISGLSSIVLVVEAAMKSGSLVTARFALEQNREVMAIPGSIKNKQSAGCHYLLQQGALLVTSPEDVLGEPGIVISSNCDTAKDLNLTDMEAHLLACMGRDIISLDVLQHHTGWLLPDIIDTLVELELKAYVRALPGGYVRLQL